MLTLPLNGLPAAQKPLAAYAAAILHALARDENAGRRPRRLTEDDLATWSRFRHLLGPQGPAPPQDPRAPRLRRAAQPLPRLPRRHLPPGRRLNRLSIPRSAYSARIFFLSWHRINPMDRLKEDVTRISPPANRANAGGPFGERGSPSLNSATGGGTIAVVALQVAVLEEAHGDPARLGAFAQVGEEDSSR